MKRTFICLLAFYAFTTVGTPAAPPAATEISVTGNGNVVLPPNLATVSASVETNADNANDAVSRNNAIYDRVVSSVESLGVARSDISLDSYWVRYNPRPTVLPTDSQERYGYIVTRNFSVKVHDIGKAGLVSDTCLKSGATGIGGVNFGISDPRAARAQATAKAVADARANAEALARAAGMHIVAIKSIDSEGIRAPVAMIARVNAAPAPTEFDQSNVSVEVNVSVVFLAQP